MSNDVQYTMVTPPSLILLREANVDSSMYFNCSLSDICEVLVESEIKNLNRLLECMSGWVQELIVHKCVSEK